MRLLSIFSFFLIKNQKSKNSNFLNSRNARETLEKRFMNTRMTSKNHVNIWTYALPTLCLLQFLWALSPKKALGPRESEDRQDDDFGSKTAKKRLRNGWVAATASKTTSIFESIGVLTRYQTSALKVYWSSSLSARRIWAPDCNISIENLEYQMIRSHWGHCSWRVGGYKNHILNHIVFYTNVAFAEITKNPPDPTPPRQEPQSHCILEMIV